MKDESAYYHMLHKMEIKEGVQSRMSTKNVLAGLTGIKGSSKFKQ